MTTTTIFLRQPTGIAIATNDFADADEVLGEIDAADYIAVTRIRDNAVLLIPVDNIASVEVV